MPSTLTPNMSLIEPTIGLEPSPTWATDLNASLTLLDQHNHAAGNGVQISPSGLNISSDLTFIGNNATHLRSVRFDAQGSPLALGTDLGCLYVSGVDLYYNDENGNQIRITQSGGVVGTPGSITGLVPPASATYVPATPAFVFQSAVNTPANLDGGSLVLRNILANSNGVTLNAPPALAANYQLTFPATLPASQKIVTFDNTGAIAANYVVDNSTIEINSNTIRVKSGGITGTQLTSNINLPGTLTLSDSLPLVVSASGASTNQKIIRGVVTAVAGITAGEGFTVTRPNPGQYDISFTTNFASIVAGVASAISSSALIATVSALANNFIRVFIWDVSGVPANSDFSFIVIGPH